MKVPRIPGVTASSAQVGIGGRQDRIRIRGDGLEGERDIDAIWINPDFQYHIIL